MKKVLAIGLVNAKRFVREKANLFFVFVFPILIVLLIGSFFGGGFNPTVGVYAAGEGSLTEGLLSALDGLENIDVRTYSTEAELVDGVQRGAVQGGLVIPVDYDQSLTSGESSQVGFVARPDQTAILLRQTIEAVIQEQGNLVRAARFAAGHTGGSFADSLAVARIVAPASQRVGVTYREAGDDSLTAEFSGLGTFDLGAHQELVLFMFLTSLAGSAALIQTRQLGVARRMLSTPTGTGTILMGETLGRFNVAMVQGLYIVLGTVLLFRVDWGDPLGALALVTAFALVGAAAGILMGAVFSNDSQAGGLGVLIGLGLAAVGGCMVPIEIFPEGMQTIAKFTPHAWAIDGFSEMVRRDGTFVDILPNLAVLAGFAAVLMLLGTWRLHRVLTR
ncbi:MAG: ABC transporter permease [Actinobacteria bacterium]|nr:ABC transporter permease [Actinomycetota bacterium]MBU1492405.1 ABC transporter permease [Actinomycetota bacterium]